MTDEIIPREKACFYWNDIPSGIPGDDVMVLSFDDPDRDRKSAHFENSTGAIDGTFLDRNSAEKVFAGFFETEYMQSLTLQFLWEVRRSWLSEFSKIEDFAPPDTRVSLIRTLAKRQAAIAGDEEHWPKYEAGVRDIVQAMKQPSTYMIYAGDGMLAGGGSAQEIYQAMILVALEELPSPKTDGEAA